MNTLPSEPQLWYASLFLSHPVACTLYESVGKHWTERTWRSGEGQHCLLVGISFASYPLSNLGFPVLALNQKSLHFEQTPALYLDQTRPLLAHWTVIVSLPVNIYQFVFVSLRLPDLWESAFIQFSLQSLILGSISMRGASPCFSQNTGIFLSSSTLNTNFLALHTSSNLGAKKGYNNFHF